MRYIRKLLIILLLLCNSISVYAENTYEDMSKWSIHILLEHCDQNDGTKVGKFYNAETERLGFCMEPYVDYNPRLYKYHKDIYEDDYLYYIYRACTELDNDEAIIAAQLMIWEYLTDESFTYNGLGAEDYGADKLRTLIEQYKTEENLKMFDIVADRGNNSLNFDHLDDYVIECKNISYEITDNVINYSVIDIDDPDTYIRLNPIHRSKGSVKYFSKQSQDLYSYEGDFSLNPSYIYKIRLKEEFKTIEFSKTDENNNPIAGARFSLYEITDNNSDPALYFIKPGTSINIIEMVLGENEANDSYQVELSERYNRYLSGVTINTDEIGYTSFNILKDNKTIDSGRIYITNDSNLHNGFYKKLNVLLCDEMFTDGNLVNSFTDVPCDKEYILCESEPKKGYEYKDVSCVYLSKDYRSESPIHFINCERSYDLLLTKENADHTIKLNGARFRITYEDDGIKEMIFITGALNIKRKHGHRYLFYRYEHSDDINLVEFDDDYFIKENIPYGRYYYYQSNDADIDKTKFNRYVDVYEGSYTFKDLPYSSSLSIEEIEAPKGYIITEAKYDLDPDLAYSQIVFRNSRVNQFEIIPANKRKIPKTCIGE